MVNGTRNRPRSAAPRRWSRGRLATTARSTPCWPGWPTRRPCTDTETFPRGTLQPDGRLDLCKQALCPVDARRVIGAAVALAAHARTCCSARTVSAPPGVAALADALDDRSTGCSTLYLGCNHVDAGRARAARRPARRRPHRAGGLAQAQPDRRRRRRGARGGVAHNASVRTLDLTNTGLTGGRPARRSPRRCAPGRRPRTAVPGRQQPRAGVRRAAGGAACATPACASCTWPRAGSATTARPGSPARSATSPRGRRVVLGLGGNGIRLDGVRALAARLAR